MDASMNKIELLFVICVALRRSIEVHCAEHKMSDYLHLIRHDNLPQSYAYGARTGLAPGLIGSEHVSVVLPPIQLPGRSRLKPWYRFSRDRWIRATLQDPELEVICKRAAQQWLQCVFRWMHFLRQQAKMEEIRGATNQELKSALQRTLLEPPAFRLEYLVFYCHLRRVWQKERPEQLVLFDPYGLCPRVCSDRSGMPEEDDEEARTNRGLIRPERRLEQCVSPGSLPTILTSRCIPDPNVGLHTSLSFSCQCPAVNEYKWMRGPRRCSVHMNWRSAGYWEEINEEMGRMKVTVRFNPPQYYQHLLCSREGTQDVAHICLNGEGSLTRGLVKPHCRRAEYCVCKRQYYGSRCDKIKDPCDQSTDKAPSGGVACRVSDGNKCIPDFGSGSYGCRCKPGFRRFEFKEGPLVGMDNCAEQVDVCQTMQCQHGKCISVSEWDFKAGRVLVMAKCQCENGWRGRLCSRPQSTNSWTPWTAWSPCQPSCQHSLYEGNRYRHRTRRCTDPYGGDCQLPKRAQEQRETAKVGEEVTELRLCRPRPCDRYLKLESQSLEKAPLDAMAVVRQTTEVLGIVTLAVCSFLLLVTIFALWTVSLRRQQTDLFPEGSRMKTGRDIKRQEHPDKGTIYATAVPL